MNIALVIEAFDPHRGGAEAWTWQFAERLIEDGHRVHIVARTISPIALEMGVVPHLVSVSRRRLSFAEAAEAMLRTLKVDLIHDTGCGWYCDVLQPHGGARAASVEQNLALMPPWLRNWKRRLNAWLPRQQAFSDLAERQYHGSSSTVIALSQRVLGDLKRYYQVPADRLLVVYNGVDIERYSPVHQQRYRMLIRQQLAVDPHEVLLLIVAHNLRLKGLPTLLRATGTLCREGHPVKLVVAGGSRLHRWHRLAAAVGAGDAVRFVGPVSDSVPYYAAADVYVQPTFYDPCSLVVLEALASGVPVITSRQNGASELITPGCEGYVLTDPSDDRELAGCLRAVLPEATRQSMRRAARELALDHTWKRNYAEIWDVYDEVLHRGKRAAA